MKQIYKYPRTQHIKGSRLQPGDEYLSSVCITRRMRKQLVDLFVAYHAKVVIVYVEPCYETLMKQNRNRKKEVPETIMGKMMNNLEVPAVHEAHDVKYITG